MHMSDALITPLVGGTMMTASIGVMAHASRNLDEDFMESRLPYMGVVGAFVFASQMINFAIPGTGSSGHIGGGMLLAILLGPQAGFITMASILLIQALFFADGGLLAYGCNLFNLGFLTCYVVYPWIYKPLSRLGANGLKKNKRFIMIAAVVASIVGLQLGSFGVVIQTLLSGRTDLPFSAFLSFMQPIHLAIGLIEGLITAAIVGYLYDQKEDLHYDLFKEETRESDHEHDIKKSRTRRVVTMVFIMTLMVGGILSHFASSNPDGLEWSVEKVVSESVDATEESSIIKSSLESVQDQVAVLPDYDFDASTGMSGSILGTSTSGIIGSLLTLFLACLLGVGVRQFRKRKIMN